MVDYYLADLFYEEEIGFGFHLELELEEENRTENVVQLEDFGDCYAEFEENSKRPFESVRELFQ